MDCALNELSVMKAALKKLVMALWLSRATEQTWALCLVRAHGHMFPLTRYLGQSSFHLDEQEYLEHLQALAELLKEWDR